MALAVSGFAQTQPIITGVDKKFGTANESVTITGSGFVATPIVYFGTGQASLVNFISSNQIRVEVPASATSGPITVINQDATDLSATSTVHFSIAFDHESGNNNFSPPTTGTPQNMGDFTYDLCLCDFNGDDLLDAVVTNNEGDNLNILTNNNSTPASASFTNTTFRNNGDPVSPEANTSHNIECGDLNNDGKPDLVVTSQASGQPYLHIYQNNSTSTISFTRIARIALPTLDGGAQRLLKRVRIVDIDGDGKKDLVVGSFTVSDFFVYLNSSSGPVSFSTTPSQFSVNGAVNAGAIYPGDFDNDGRADLVIVPHRATGQLFVMRNQSTPGSVNFSLVTSTGNQRDRNNVITGDFNNDGFIDIVATNETNDGIDVFENIGNFNFSSSTFSSSGASVWGLDAGDMNGDGLTDVIVTSNTVTSSILYFENTSTTSISFASAVSQNTGASGRVRNVKIGDLNQDGKPDLAFTDGSITGASGQFNYIINDLCMTPVITPASGVYCNGSEFILRATGGEGLTYTWDVTDGGGSVPVSDTDNEIDLNSLGGLTGSINVSVNAAVVGSTFCDAGGDSDPAGFSTGSAGEGQPSITDPGVVCFGDNFTLVSPTTGLANYHWSGPNGFSETTSVPIVEVSDNATFENSGTYTLVVDDGDCLSPEQTIDIVISGPPVTTIESTNCDDGSITLEVPDFSNQFTYQWKRGVSNVGTDSPTHTDTQVGSYTLAIEDANSCVYTTEAFEIYTSSYTGPSFGAVNEICVDVETTFTSGQTGTGITNSWEIVDPSMNVTSFSGNELTTSFSTVGTWEVRLNTVYTSASSGGVGIGCTAKTIAVSDLPDYAIEANSVDNTGPITKCPSEDLTLGFSEVVSGDILSVTWDSLGTSVAANTLVINEPGTYNATYTTNTGCEETVSLEIINHPDLGLAATDPDGAFTNTIVEGEVELGDGQLSVTLSVDSDVTGTTWSIVPESGDATIEPSGNSLLVTPKTPTVSIQVIGTTTEGCDETEQLLILGGTFTARKSFSPNGDGTNDFWGIINGSVLTGCTVYILDTRGRVVFETASPFNESGGESQIWDGNFNGTEVPEGVYYFVLKCDDSVNNQSGSILLAR